MHDPTKALLISVSANVGPGLLSGFEVAAHGVTVDRLHDLSCCAMARLANGSESRDGEQFCSPCSAKIASTEL